MTESTPLFRPLRWLRDISPVQLLRASATPSDLWTNPFRSSPGKPELGEAAHPTNADAPLSPPAAGRSFDVPPKHRRPHARQKGRSRRSGNTTPPQCKRNGSSVCATHKSADEAIRNPKAYWLQIFAHRD